VNGLDHGPIDAIDQDFLDEMTVYFEIVDR